MNLHLAFAECWASSENYIHCECGGDYLTKREGGTLKIFFEMSDGADDWINNFRFFAVPCKPYKDMEKLWFAHRGFLKVWKAIEPHIASEIRAADVEKIEIVGYSHGAALAVLCTEYCAYNRPDIEVEGAGFGAPRVFWGIVPGEVKERLKNFKIVRNGADIVTHVPPRIFGFRHIGEMVKIGDSKRPFRAHFPEEYFSNLKGM
jgi:predicted lipase